MKTQRFTVALTVINLLILMPILFHANSATTPEIAPVLRGRALEIVDEQGRVRAMIKVLPPDTKVKMPDGTVGGVSPAYVRRLSGETTVRPASESGFRIVNRNGFALRLGEVLLLKHLLSLFDHEAEGVTSGS